MSDWSDEQQRVFDLAKKRLQEQPWYSGVCMDSFPSDEDIRQKGINACVQQVFDETSYWDGPTWSNIQSGEVDIPT